MTKAQQYELGAYVNLMESSTMLLVNPILGLQPKYSEWDYEKLCDSELTERKEYFIMNKNLVIFMANMLYDIELDDKDKELLAKSLNKNNDFLSNMHLSSNELSVDDICMAERALKIKGILDESEAAGGDGCDQVGKLTEEN